MITVTVKENEKFDSLLKEINTDIEQLKEKANDLGGETALQMILYIQGHKVRPQNGMPAALESHINAELFEDGWGVGEIEDLNQNAPWWPAINWGSSHMVGRRVPNGWFQPGVAQPTPDAFRDGRWMKDPFQGPGMRGGNTGLNGAEGGAHWSFIVRNPIPAMNYIEKTQDWLNTEIDKLTFSE